MDDEMMDDEFLEDDDEDEDALEEKPAKVNVMSKQRSRAAEAGGDDMDDDDDDDDGGGESMDFGVSRKNPEARRREIFGAPGHLGRSLVAACVNSAGSMLRSATASDVLFETCSGGAGGVVVAAVGEAQMRELHAAVAEAARASVAGEAPAADDEDADGSVKEVLPLHEDYFSTRALRRMVLEISGDGDGIPGDAKHRAPPFAAALWEGAVSRDVPAWIGGHGAKVVAAIVKAGDAATVKACVAALAKALPRGQSPTSWAEGFFRQRSDEKADGKAKAAKTPAGKKKVSKKADENAATPAAAARESVSKSPKDKKFSPRQTRAQRLEKAAKGKK